MGDIIALFASLNLSPLNTILLAGLVLILRALYQRIEALEQSVAFIKGKLGIEE